MEKRMPRCLGAFEADDPQCDGNPVGKTKTDKAPCVFRDRCAAFVRLMTLTKKPREWYVRTGEEPSDDGPRVYTYANHADFEQQLNQQIDAYGIRDGRITSTKPIKLRLAAARPKAAKVRDKQIEKGKQKAREVAQWYVKRIGEKLKRKVATFEQAARPGDLFLVDKSETSGYCALYCKGKGRKHAVTSFIYKPLSGQLEVRLAVSWDDYIAGAPALARDELKALDHTGKDGAFRVRIRDVDTGRAGIIANALYRVLKRFDPGFPEARPEK